ncbi:MAG: hypothetical protein HYV60_12520 [Planctomycetia bacterium]|nr:hypothetical protein [Planctomycetia bacterium]
MNLLLHAEGIQPIEHTLKCQVVCDFEKQEATLLSDEFEFLDLYRVRIGNAAPEVNSGLQLKELQRLGELFEVSRTGRMALVETLDGIPMFSATRRSDEECEVEVNADFPLYTAQFRFSTLDGSHRLNMFVRRGHVIMDSEKSYITRTYGSATLTVIIPYTARETNAPGTAG